MNSTSVSLRERKGLEQILSPTLSLIATAEPIRVEEITRRLAHAGLLGRVAPHELNIVSPAGQTVVQATISLKEAGLIESVGPAVWGITSAGRRQLSKAEPITFETLRGRPKYKQYLERLERDTMRRSWQELRFDSYAAGRMLTLHGSVHMAPAALAYAIEYSLKAALTELRKGLISGRVLGSHDLRELYRTCLAHDRLTDTFIAEDFLKYAQHHFERRYPRGGRELLAAKRYWVFGVSFLATYDDCLIQLERSLDKLYASGEWSCGNRALTVSAGDELTHAFFHGNVFALERLPDYRASVDPRLTNPHAEYLDSPELLFASGQGLPHPQTNYQKARDLLSLNLVALFVYPEDGAPHPDPARTYFPPRTPLPGHVYDYGWILERLRLEFGFSAVEVTENRPTSSVVILVYDRRAKQYWAGLEVSRGHLPRLIRNQQSRAFVEQWIAQVKAMFAADPRELRVPDSAR